MSPMSASPTFPASVSVDARSFVDGNGIPWFGMGDTAWSLLVQLDEAQVRRYLRDRRDRGFNVILVNLIEKRYGASAPANALGDLPFAGSPFSSEPNEKYWAFVDAVLAEAKTLGITVMLCPAYLGKASEEGWAEDAAKASDSDLARYGRFLRNRYQHLPNVMWLIGHDRVPNGTEKSRMEALAKELPPEDLIGLGANPDASALGNAPWEPTSIIADFETIYSYAETPITDTTRGWEQTPARPVVFLEGHYEQEDTQLGDVTLRYQTYGSFVAGASGAFFGNNPIWHFDSGRELFPFSGTWEENLGSPGSVDSASAWKIIESMPWADMVPDTQGSFLVSGAGEGSEQAGARLSAGYAAVYQPTSRTIQLDLSALQVGSSIELHRFDPRSAADYCIGTFAPTSEVTVTEQGTNSAGASDWLFVARAGQGCT